MKKNIVRFLLCVGVASAGLESSVLAQERTVLGTVAAIEVARLQVRVVDDATKHEDLIWFSIGNDTRVKRGDTNLSLADARIATGERIAVITDARTATLAAEIRLAASAEKPTQTTVDPHAGHQMPAGHMAQMAAAPQAPHWMFMQDGAVWAMFNSQGGPRGGEEFMAPNWWMGMAIREKDTQTFGLNAMLSLDAATLGNNGYREIFQIGEALDGKPLIDRQHPHDLFMQLAAAWRVKLGEKTSLTFSGGPAGEPTLGPVAFMHRASASGLVLAPLGHHTFDSTHISYGVVAAAFERGPLTVEASAFNGREPDQERWDFDFGPLDSYAARVWFRPNESWEAQVSSGFLKDPEELVPGDARRTTASLSWLQQRSQGMRAVTVGYGVNDAHGEHRHGVFGEFTFERGRNSVSGRLEFQQVETELLLTGQIPADGHDAADPATVTALTLGGSRQLIAWRGWEGAVGAHVAFYAVPDVLEASYSNHPVSAQVFFRLRLPTGPMGRMWNMRMSRIHQMGDAHAGHHMSK